MVDEAGTLGEWLNPYSPTPRHSPEIRISQSEIIIHTTDVFSAREQ